MGTEEKQRRTYLFLPISINMSRTENTTIMKGKGAQDLESRFVDGEWMKVMLEERDVQRQGLQKVKKRREEREIGRP